MRRLISALALLTLLLALPGVAWAQCGAANLTACGSPLMNAPTMAAITVQGAVNLTGDRLDVRSFGNATTGTAVALGSPLAGQIAGGQIVPSYCQMASGSNSLYCPGANFTGAIGDKILVWGADSPPTVQGGTIASVADSTHATLNFTATTDTTFYSVAGYAYAPAQSGTGSYAPGDTVAVSGGTGVTTVASYTINNTAVVSAAVAAGGTGGTAGTCTATLSGGNIINSGSSAQVVGTVSGGALGGTLVVSTPGMYFGNFANLSAVPITGCGLSGATVSVTMGPGVYGLVPSAVGQYATLPGNPAATTTSGAGTGLQLNLTSAQPGSALVLYYPASADATAALQATANAVPASGATIEIPPGNYPVSNNILLPTTGNTRIHCEKGAVLYAAAASEWPVAGIGATFKATAGSNFTIDGTCAIQYPYGPAYSGSAGEHIISFAGGINVAQGIPAYYIQNVHVSGMIIDGGGDGIATIGATHVFEHDNLVTNADNACFDHWLGDADVHVEFNSCSINFGTSGSFGIEFTALDTNNNPTSFYDADANGNDITISGGQSGGIVVNGIRSSPCTALDDRISLTHNRIKLIGGNTGSAINTLGCGGSLLIQGNIVSGSGAATTSLAIHTDISATFQYGAIIANNWVNNWNSSSGGGVYNNTATTGSLIDNHCNNCNGPLIAANGKGANVLLYGNDDGRGVYKNQGPTLPNAAVATATTVGDSPIGSASFTLTSASGIVSGMTVFAAAGVPTDCTETLSGVVITMSPVCATTADIAAGSTLTLVAISEASRTQLQDGNGDYLLDQLERFSATGDDSGAQRCIHSRVDATYEGAICFGPAGFGGGVVIGSGNPAQETYGLYVGSGGGVSVKSHLTVGTVATFPTASAGEIALAKETASGTAPGAGFLKFEAVAGTNAGSCKIIAYAGTSTAPVTVIDNVGSGC